MKYSLLVALGLGAFTASAVIPLAKLEPRAGTLREISTDRKTSDRALMRHAPQREAALSLPASFPIATQDEFNTYQTIDANGDGKTWKYENKAACYEGIGTSFADDWLILGPVDLSNTGGSFALNFEAWKTFLAESYEVCISATGTPDDAIQIYSTSDVPNSAAPVSVDFTVAEPGAYYLMFHATSPSNGISLYIKNITVDVNAPQGFSVPFEMTPQSEEAKHFTVINANEDGKTWGYDLSNNGFAIECAAANASDDWLLFPEIEFPAAGNYLFKWDARVWGDPQALDIYFGQGDNPADFTCIFSEKEAKGEAYTREVVFTVPQAGMYRMALYSDTPANRYKLLVRNFVITATDRQPAAELPLEVASMQVTSEYTFTPAFVYTTNTRVKISCAIEGDAVNFGIANAPAAKAVTNLFSLSAEDAQAGKVLTLPGNGIGYLALSADDNASVSNLKVEIYDEAAEAFQLPFAMQPTAEEFLDFKVVNANDDASTWTYYDQFGAPRYNWSNTDKANDWLILPAINIPDTDGMIDFSFNVRGMGVSFRETLEVWAGQSDNIEEMVMLYASPEIRNEAFTPYSFSFSPQWKGVTYFAVRATSEPKMFHIFVRDFEIKADGRPVSIPAVAENLTAVPEGHGSTNATLTFTFPTLTAGGAPLDTEATLTADIVSREATLQATGLPGQEVSLTVNNGQGEGTISVTVTNAAGTSNPASVSVYTGVDRPAQADVTSVTADNTNRKATIKWELSEVGATGGFVNLENVKYTVKHSIGNGNYQNVATVEGDTEYTYSIPDSYPLEMHYFMVVASNAAGEGEQGHGSGIMLGRPHSIPVVEEFADNTIALGPIGMSNPDERYTLDWYFDDPSLGFEEAANNSGKALIAFTEEFGPARGRLNLPKFDTRSDNGARLTLRVYNYPHFANTDIFVEIADGEPVKIGNIAPAEVAGWKEYSFPLTDELLNREWVAPYIDFGFEGTFDDEIWMLDRFGMENYYDTELDIRPVLTHSRMKVGEEYVWKFQVGNFGKSKASYPYPVLNFTTENGDVVSFPGIVPENMYELAPGEVKIWEYNVKLGTEMEGEIVYDITVQQPADNNPDNNTLFDTLEVWQQDEFVVRDLHIGEGDNGAQLEWTAPSTGYGILYADNLMSWDYGTDIGLFTNIDGDGMPVTGFVGQYFPGMGQPKAWQVFDYEDGGFNYIYAGYLGSAKSLIAFSPSPGYGAADDWLISPEVKGGTELTFYVRPLHFRYGSETVEILTSSATQSLSDFHLLTTYNTEVGEADKTPYWEEVNVTLPANARFFAIRYVSNDIFGLQLDDIIYTSAQEESDKLTYTVLKDNEVIASGVLGLTFPVTEKGVYQVAAEKAYAGLHPVSNAVTFEGTNSIALPTADAPCEYYDLEGRKIAAPTEPGIYILKRGTETRKVIIR